MSLRFSLQFVRSYLWMDTMYSERLEEGELLPDAFNAASFNFEFVWEHMIDVLES